jgi:predicted enzyme related to lactoylglutathione lyase
MEIPVKNAQRAIQFYRNVFDWNIHEEGYEQQLEGIERVYFFSKGNFHGSFLLVPEDQFFDSSKAFAASSSGSGADEGRTGTDQKILWAVGNTFAVEDMDETLKRIIDSGGRIFRYV